MTPPESYKPTFLDKHGPEGMVRFTAVKYAIVVFVLTLPMFATLGVKKLGLSGFAAAFFTLGASATLSVLSYFFSMALANTAGSAASTVYMGGKSTPHEDSFSQEEALVMKEDYAGALALYERRIEETKDEPRVRIAAADLYVKHGNNPKRAAELYREVQRIPDVASGHDIYASNKLADLFLGPLDEPRRALVELRRLVERYPSSPHSKHARTAINNIKSQLNLDAT